MNPEHRSVHNSEGDSASTLVTAGEFQNMRGANGNPEWYRTCLSGDHVNTYKSNSVVVVDT